MVVTMLVTVISASMDHIEDDLMLVTVISASIDHIDDDRKKGSQRFGHQ